MTMSPFGNVPTGVDSPITPNQGKEIDMEELLFDILVEIVLPIIFS
jgi:hypothetical protein